MDFAGILTDFARQLTDECRFPRAVRADERMNLAGPHVERDVVRGEQAAEPFAQAADVEQGRLAHGARRRRTKKRRSPIRPPCVKRTTTTSTGPSTICQFSVTLVSQVSRSV